MHNNFRHHLQYWNQQYLASYCSASEFAAELLLFGFDQFQNKKLLKTLNCESRVIQFLNDHHWKNHTDRIRRALIFWHLGEYPLVLMDQIPTPFELLQLQAQGKRVVTVFSKFEDWNRQWGKFSAREFTLHDLIHADHFFENKKLHQEQTRFYQFILKNWQQPDIQKLHEKKGFEYLISDMNSHPQHLLQTLTALVIEDRKESLKISSRNRLPSEEENKCQKTFIDWQRELGL